MNMTGEMTASAWSLEVGFASRDQMLECYLSSAPHGGLMVPVARPMEEGDSVHLDVTLRSEHVTGFIRGAVLWCRHEDQGHYLAGIGFFAAEAERREHLLGTPPPPPTAPSERRETRYDSTLKVTYQTATDFVVDYTRNISTGGIFVDSQRAPAIGSRILFKLYPPGQETPIDLPGEVAWSRPGGGFGVRFASGSRPARDRLHKLVRSVAIGAPASSYGAPVFEEVTPV